MRPSGGRYGRSNHVTAKSAETSPTPAFPESSFKYNPLMHVRVLFLNFIRGLFAAAPPGSFHWTPDDETTELYVSDEEVIQPEVVQKLPAVNIVRGPIQFYSLGLDDMEAYDFALNRKTKGILLPGTITINACSKVPLESESIAFIIAEHIWLLRDLLMRAGFFEVGRSIQLGAPSPAGSIIANDAGDEFTATPISVPFQFARLSAFTPLGMEVVNSIEQTLTAYSARCVRSNGTPAQTHEFPFGYYAAFPSGMARGVPTTGSVGDVAPRADVLQPHPLNPARMVRVRVVRPNRAGSRLGSSPAAIPITRRSMEQSCSSVPAIKQKG